MGIDGKLDKNVIVTSLDFMANWARRSSLWPLDLEANVCKSVRFPTNSIFRSSERKSSAGC